TRRRGARTSRYPSAGWRQAPPGSTSRHAPVNIRLVRRQWRLRAQVGDGEPGKTASEHVPGSRHQPPYQPGDETGRAPRREVVATLVPAKEHRREDGGKGEVEPERRRVADLAANDVTDRGGREPGEDDGEVAAQNDPGVPLAVPIAGQGDGPRLIAEEMQCRIDDAVRDMPQPR